MKVISVNWGSAAKRAGREGGDIITKINSFPLYYDQALISAANYNYGAVHMKVRNVRFDRGYQVPKYTYVQTVLDGYGGPIGPQGPVGPAVAARRR